jgi:GDP-4-dehydro-6-deoxy-D-mannose reductase
MVRALTLAARHCEGGEVFNVGGQVVFSVQEIIDLLRELSGESFEVVQEKSLMRVTDEPVIHGDTSRFERATGWKPEVPLRESLQDMLVWWRERLAANVEPLAVHA